MLMAANAFMTYASGHCSLSTQRNATHIAIMSLPDQSVVFGTEDLLMSLCNSVTRVLYVATQSQVHYSGMVQRISKTCLKPDIGCFVMAASRAWSSSISLPPPRWSCTKATC